jgi:hypothetical protein
VTNAEWAARRANFARLQAIAPADIQGDWATSVAFFDKFTSLLHTAGLSVEDLKTLQAHKLPPGVDKAKVLALGPKVQQLEKTSGLAAAQQAISSNAAKQCHLTLGTGSN